ncbi:SAM-dependent methyltransferase [Microbacterium halotolerans]|uniref:SAM-dependent methyltransferase n=1 Tax=Microbacterium halotolerans TaxID=246613 RepID=UPI000E6ACEE0|nr:SAM-dependent methyltransferase [Microbacterium halotolerans]
MTPTFSSGWLAVREPEDARARSTALAEALASQVHGAPIIAHDLGSGTGSMMRWLAPMLPGPQSWHLHDRDARLLRRVAGAPRPVDDDGSVVSVSTHVGALDDLGPEDLRGASLITASALLDVLTEDELRAVVSRCVAASAPVLFALTVTGDVAVTPADPLDDDLRAAFNAHQQRAHAGVPLLGPTAVDRARALFDRAGWEVRVADTPWRLGGHAPRLLAEWLAGWTDAAVEQGPQLQSAAAGYRARRTAQARAGALSVDVHHRDLMAWPR